MNGIPRITNVRTRGGFDSLVRKLQLLIAGQQWLHGLPARAVL